MTSAPAELAGDFDSTEARFLRGQFDDCRIELIARSRLDRRTALLRWQPAAGLHPHAVESRSPRLTDRRHRPLVAWYVLEHEPELRLAPVASRGDLHKHYPGHFDANAVPDQPARKGCLPFGRWLLPLLGAVALASN